MLSRWWDSSSILDRVPSYGGAPHASGEVDKIQHIDRGSSTKVFQNTLARMRFGNMQGMRYEHPDQRLATTSQTNLFSTSSAVLMCDFSTSIAASAHQHHEQDTLYQHNVSRKKIHCRRVPSWRELHLIVLCFVFVWVVVLLCRSGQWFELKTKKVFRFQQHLKTSACKTLCPSACWNGGTSYQHVGSDTACPNVPCTSHWYY